MIEKDFKIPGRGEELAKKVKVLFKDLVDAGWDLGVNEFAPYGQISIRPKGETSKTSDLGFVDFRDGFVRVYENKTLCKFLEKI